MFCLLSFSVIYVICLSPKLTGSGCMFLSLIFLCYICYLSISKTIREWMYVLSLIFLCYICYLSISKTNREWMYVFVSYLSLLYMLSVYLQNYQGVDVCFCLLSFSVIYVICLSPKLSESGCMFCLLSFSVIYVICLSPKLTGSGCMFLSLIFLCYICCLSISKTNIDWMYVFVSYLSLLYLLSVYLQN